MRKLPVKKLAVLLLLLLSFQLSWAQQTAHKIVVEEMKYLVYLPEGYQEDNEKQWPLMIFLHGAGESGEELDKIKMHGPPKLIEQGKKFPFIVVSPQSLRGGWNPFYVKTLVEKAQSDYRVDNERIYLTGLSMGGFGTWNTATMFPDIFAAILPICGGGDPRMAKKLSDMPVWCFHGDEDNVVDIKYSQQMIDSLKPHNDNVKFTIYPGVTHDSWTQTYENDEIYEWLLSHKRIKPEAIKPDEE